MRCLPRAVVVASATPSSFLPFGTRFFCGLAQVDMFVHALYPGERNEVVLASGGRVVLGELDTVGAVHVVNGADVCSVGAEDRQVFFDVRWVYHNLIGGRQ